LSNAYNDDGGPPSASGFSSSVLAGSIVNLDGTLRTKIDGFGSAVLSPYEFWQIVVRPNEFGIEIEPNNSTLQATAFTNVALSASAGEDDDYYSFFANAGEKLVVMMDNNPVDETPNDPTTDPLANIKTDILGTDGLTVLNITNTTSTRAIGPVVAPATGTYYARVHRIDVNQGLENPPYSIVVLVDGASPELGACCNGTACTLKSSTNCVNNFFGIGVSCSGDADADTFPNACDNCASVANAIQEDNDSDGVGNICDGCPEDFNKTSAGQCGCGNKDFDGDGDGTADCIDGCALDANKSAPQVCGCGVADIDSNANGVVDCQKGADLKAQLEKIGLQIKTFKLNKKVKTTAIKLLISSIKTDVETVAGQIVLLDANFQIAQKTNSLAKAINALTKANSDNIKARKKVAAKIVQSILAAIA